MYSKDVYNLVFSLFFQNNKCCFKENTDCIRFHDLSKTNLKVFFPTVRGFSFNMSLLHILLNLKLAFLNLPMSIST
jgi:hypothetical protein